MKRGDWLGVGAGLVLGLGLFPVMFPENVVAQDSNAVQGGLEEAKRLNEEAGRLYKEGRYGEAIPLVQRGLAIREQALGADHLDLVKDLNNLALLYKKQKNYEAALPLYQRSLFIREKALGSDHVGTAQILNELASLYQDQRNYAAALPLFQRSLTIYEKARGSDHADVATILSNLARLYQEQGNYAVALPLFQRSLAIYEKNLRIDDPSLADVIYDLASTYHDEENYEAALPLYQRSLAIYEKALGLDHPAVARNLHNLARLYKSQGNYAAALPLFQRSLGIREKVFGLNHPAVASSLLSLASLYQDTGDYQTALSLAERSLLIRETVLKPDNPDIADSLESIAVLHQRQGNYSISLPLYQRSLAIREKALGADHLDVAQSLSNLAALYTFQGNYAVALPLVRRGLEIREKSLSPDHILIANSLNNLAALYGKQGNYEESQPLLKRALEIATKKLGENHKEVAQLVNNLASLYAYQKKYTTALDLYQRSLAIREKTLGASHPDLAEGLNNLATLYAYQKNYIAALELYQRSLAIREKALGTLHPLVATSLNNLASLYWANNTPANSLPLFQKALDIEEYNLSQNLVVGSESYKRNYLKTFTSSTDLALSYHLQALPNSIEATNLALTTILRRKGRLQDVLSNLILTLRQNLTPADAQRFDELVAVRNQIAQITFSPDFKLEQVATLKTLEANADKIEAELSQRSATFQAVTQPVTIAAVQAKIPADAALIEFIQYKPFNPKTGQFQAPRYAAYILLPKGNVQWVDLGDAAKLEAQLKEFMSKIREPRPGFLPQTKLAARQMDAILFQSIRAKVGPGVKHFLIAPDAELNLIPFAALVDEQNRFLIETYQITYLTSGRDLLRRSTPSSNPPLLFANIDYDRPGQPQPNNTAPILLAQGTSPVSSTRGTNQTSQDLAKLTFGPLDNTGPEAAAIKTLLPNAQAFTGTAATENVIKANQHPIVLHLATHGFFFPPEKVLIKPNNFGAESVRGLGGQISELPVENPLLRSGLWLAGANVRQSGEEDGILTALEVSGLNLNGTQLVVLSACDSGKGDVPTGEGVYGLRRAFTLAGAESQLSTLWQVDDAKTKEIMVNYYQRLLQGQGRGEAMRQAQLELIALQSLPFVDNNAKYANPYYWAAFVPIGEWRPMQFSKNPQR